jgi:secreted trypsin-like serine protease
MVKNNQLIKNAVTAPGSFPWIARIAYMSYYKSGTVFKCNGVIANRVNIITAAHCLNQTGIYTVV